METDEELVRRSRAGDAQAFGVLIDRHQRAVAGFLLSVLRDPDSAQEVAQVAFVKAYKALGSFEGRSSFKTWVSRIALNAARTQLRWEKLRRYIPLDGHWDGDDDAGRWEERLRLASPPEDAFKALERKLDLERALARLAPREREVAGMRLEGYALGEIAEILEVSEGTVKSTLFDATRKMKESLS